MSKIQGANVATVWKEHRVLEGKFNFVFEPISDTLVLLEILSNKVKRRKIRKGLLDKISNNSFTIALRKTLK